MYETFGRQTLFSTLMERDLAVSFSREHWRELASMGIFRTDSLKDSTEAFFQLAKGSVDLPFCLSAIAQNIAVKLIAKYGSAEQKLYLEKIQSGDWIVAVANTEESGGTDVKSLNSSFDADSGILKLHKRGASNLSDADLIIASAWKIVEGKRHSLEVFLVEKSQVQQTSHNDQLMGFRTGQTGALLANLTLSVSAQLGPDKSGFAILKDCFNFERLWIPTIIAGVLDASLELAYARLKCRTSMNKPLFEFQYVQEKLYRIYKAKTILLAMIHQISSRDIATCNKELAVLKSMAIEEGLDACLAFFESVGYEAYTQTHVASKLIRDILAFKFLGGTVEQQKMVFFQDLMHEYNQRDSTGE